MVDVCDILHECWLGPHLGLSARILTMASPWGLDFPIEWQPQVIRILKWQLRTPKMDVPANNAEAMLPFMT